MSDIDIEQQTHLINKNIINGINASHKSNTGGNKIELIWQNVSYSVRPFKWSFNIKKLIRNDSIQLISNLSGKVESGQLTAIIGPSGAGKTTLLECLAGRRRVGVSGNIAVNGAKKKAKLAYNSQHESLMSHLTVKETLMFASKLKNYQNNRDLTSVVDKNENIYSVTTFPAENVFVKIPDSVYHENIVQSIMCNLGLEQCAHVRVGNCSGGQQRRLSIALELISSPSILLLDEPTSGLDSVSCLQCVSLLRNLVQMGEPMIILISIHQPTARLLSYFDNLYIISSTGRCIYNGPTTQMIDYLNDQFNLKCPQFHNPADFITEIACGDYGFDVINKLSVDQQKNKIDGISESSIDIRKICNSSRKQKKMREAYKTWILFQRCMLISVRDPTFYMLRLMALIMILVLISIVYSKTHIGVPNSCTLEKSLDLLNSMQSFDYSVLKDPKNSAILNLGWIFFSTLFVAFVTMMPTVLTFPIEVSVFIKEYFNGWYSLGSYFLAKNLANVPPAVIFPLIYGVISYFITEQIPDMWRFLTFIIIILIMSFLTDGFGLTISAYFNSNLNAACIAGAISQIPFLLFTGLLVQINSLPNLLQPMTYLSFYRLCFEATTVTFYGFDRCPKLESITANFVNDVFGGNLFSVGYCLNEYGLLQNISAAFDNFNKTMHTSNPSLVMQGFSLNDQDLYFSIAIMIIQVIFFRVLAYLILYYKVNSKI